MAALRRVPVAERVLTNPILVDVKRAYRWDDKTESRTDECIGVTYEVTFPGLKYTNANLTLPESTPLLIPQFEDEDFELEPGQVVELTGKVNVEAYIGRNGLGLAVEAGGIRFAGGSASKGAAPAGAAAPKSGDK